MGYHTILSGQRFTFDSVKEVMAKAGEHKSGDVLAGVAAASDIERIAAKDVLAGMTLRELYENPAAPYEEDEVTRINIDGLNRKYLARSPAGRSATSGNGSSPMRRTMRRSTGSPGD